LYNFSKIIILSKSFKNSVCKDIIHFLIKSKEVKESSIFVKTLLSGQSQVTVVFSRTAQSALYCMHSGTTRSNGSRK